MARLLLASACCGIWQFAMPMAIGEASQGDGQIVLETIFIEAASGETFGGVSETHHQIRSDDLLAEQVLDTADLIGRLPSANVTTNSRGETLVYLRNAGERQVAMFFDGALLNIPWDNRFDRSALPAGVIGQITSASGTLSPQYGVSAIGAVSITPAQAFATEASISGGQGGQRAASLSGGWSGLHRELSGAASWRARDGEILSEDADLPFNQADSDLRTNTDREQVSILARAAMEAGDWNLAASFLAVRMERGVAPEGDRPDARFWRQPDTQLTMLTVSGSRMSDRTGRTKASAWMQDHDLTIDSYTDATYAFQDGREIDDDRTYGARGLWVISPDPWRVTFSANLLNATHRQTDLEFNASNVAIASETLTYEQMLGAGGVDLEWAATFSLRLELGLGVDWTDYTQTGDKPGMDPFIEPVLRTAAAWQASEALRLRVAAGRKTRTPTMRELFGQALNRFLINPDLRPEVISTYEAGLDFQSSNWRLSAAAFMQDVDDTIDPRRVDGLRQRINLEGSEAIGAEFAVAADLNKVCEASVRAMWTRLRRTDAPEIGPNRLAERPASLVGFGLAWRP